MVSKIPPFVPEQRHQAQDTLAAEEIQPQRPMPAESMPPDTMWGLHQAAAESRKIALEGDVDRRRCSRPSSRLAPSQLLLSGHTEQIRPQSGSCRAARSNR